MSPTPTPPAVPSCLIRAQAGNDDAFTELFHATVPKVRKVVAGVLGGRLDADDIVAETYLRAWQHLGTFKVRDAAFNAWLCTIARNCAYTALRRVARKPTVARDGGWWATRTTTADFAEEVVTRAAYPALYAAIAELPMLQRDTVIWRYFEERSLAECARLLGRTIGATKALQHRAIGALRRRLDTSEALA